MTERHWPPPAPELTRSNVSREVRRYAARVEALQLGPVAKKRGIDLLHALKREQVSGWPYPKKLTRSEAYNRIMTDLVILHGVRWLLANGPYPFRLYRVKYGNTGGRGFDVEANAGRRRLVGEAFNAAPSYYPKKRRDAIGKLSGPAAEGATVRIILLNHDARPAPKAAFGLDLLSVNVRTGTCSFVRGLAGRPR